MKGDVLKIGDILIFKGKFCMCALNDGDKAEVVGFGVEGVVYCRLFATWRVENRGCLVEINTIHGSQDYWEKLEGHKVVK